MANAIPVASAAERAFDTGYRAVKRGEIGQALFDLDLDLAISKAEQPARRADARCWRIIALARSSPRAARMRRPACARRPRPASRR